ncbi:TlpA family protein disulfide reductase [Pilimelia anulata]|uniref:TlpA family protein disulfide reductase n=1 Tax=Pilimelia anulata TaxID=53371 RepID=UPI001663124E|nr:TlpA disulfide reductase family protein [Pilimelia anulata]
MRVRGARRPHRPRPLRALAAAGLVLAVLALAGARCGGPDAPAGPPPGGAAHLPGPAPADPRLRPTPTGAPGAPDFAGTLVDGTAVRGADLWARRPVVLLFVSSWCTPCAERADALSALAERYRDRVVFVAVAARDEPADLAAYLRAHRVAYPVVVDADETIWRSYAVREPPAVAVVAAGGGLLRGWPGGLDAATLDARLHELVLAD